MSDVTLMAERDTNCSHLPGPWEMERLDHWQRYDIGVRLPEGGFRLAASVDFGFSEPAESQQHANARLITAAPDLYATLNDVLDSFDRQTMEEMLRKDNDPHDDDEFCVNLTAKQLRAINQAILKAEGKV